MHNKSLEKLNNFLEEHCCKEQYWGNVKRDRFYPKYSPDNNSSMCEKEFIDTSFVWKESVQGQLYWSEIDRMWQLYLNDVKEGVKLYELYD